MDKKIRLLVLILILVGGGLTLYEGLSTPAGWNGIENFFLTLIFGAATIIIVLVLILVRLITLVLRKKKNN